MFDNTSSCRIWDQNQEAGIVILLSGRVSKWKAQVPGFNSLQHTHIYTHPRYGTEVVCRPRKSWDKTNTT